MTGIITVSRGPPAEVAGAAAGAGRQHLVQNRIEREMPSSHFQQFLDEATTPDPSSDHPLGPDCLYGLYVSWASLHGFRPKSDQAFRAGMLRCGVHPDNCRLHMTGPAAADYILYSYPAVA
ncbi:hypothetical protein [Arthrobacter sp. W4I7]|uniref:hypothetical protein n=1 Tax=Arthrobacter sp. W4I7 TaxID=3042296 RepID=UPI00278489C1|nr:hypothetical protein [Arthrobacter sp. W4I7]MDQ0689763.1 hypothetical protein [Arthrobacter sp. W4I7]